MTDGQPPNRVPRWLQQLDPAVAPQDAPENTPQDAHQDVPLQTQALEHAATAPGDQRSDQGASDAVAERHSLDDLLHNDTLACGEIPEAIDLPLSVASSQVSEGVLAEQINQQDMANQASQTSLEVLSRTAAPNIPSHIPLPDSDVTESDNMGELVPAEPPQQASALESRARMVKSRRRKPPPRLTYDKVIDNAAKVLDHIKDGNVKHTSRHQRTSIAYFDYADDMMSEARQVYDHDDIPPLRYVPPRIKQRLIIAEDLSKPTIDALGLTFRINPEFFEEHLLNSSYAGAKYDQPPSRTWKTAGMIKSYISFRWIRPVYRQPTYFSHRDLPDLLEDCTEHFTHRGRVTTRVRTNIFRMEWGLWTDPGKTVRMERESGMEERVSIWKGSLPERDCDIVIVLLDPLPEIKEDHQLWGNESVDTGDDGKESTPEPSIAESDLMEEGFGGLFDAEPQRVRDGNSLSRLWAEYIVRRRWRRLESIDTNSYAEPEKEMEPGKIIIKQMAPRQAVAADLDTVFRMPRRVTELGDQLSQTKSTRADICDALGRHRGTMSFVGPLIEIIRRDTLTLLQQLRRILDEVEVDILDDRKMEDRLVLWRQLINRAQRELPEIKTSMSPFQEFLKTIDPPNLPEEQFNEEQRIIEDFQKLPNDIDQTVKRLRAVSASLTSNMGLLDSRRSIDEAQAVTRLTELAFIFIPLSFATSVFGMQIEPFADPAPIWKFFVVAVVVTAFAYIMRMTMRSQWLARLKAGVRSDVRKYAEKHGKSVQTRSLPMLLIFQWLANRTTLIVLQLARWIGDGCMWLLNKGLWGFRKFYSVFGFIISLVLLIGVISAVPVAVVCSQNLESGIKTAVSIGIVGIVFAVIGVPYWHNSEPTFRNALPKFVLKALPKLMLQGFQSMPPWARISSLSLFTGGAFIATPLALIWTRSLARDIKIGLTAGIVVSVVLVLGMVVAWWSTARKTRHRFVRKLR